MIFALSFLRTIWQSTSMCLVLSWNTSFSVMCIFALLLSYSLIGHSGGKSVSVNKSLIQINFNVTFAIALYSDFALDGEITLCYLLFHDTRFPLRKIQYHVINLLSKGPCLVCIREVCYSNVFPDLNREAPPWNFLQIHQNLHYCLQVDSLQCWQKLTHYADCECDVWFSHY